ncbi:hypothetical protein ACT3UK_11870 [Glutamicibacter sp. AOP33-2CA-4]
MSGFDLSPHISAFGSNEDSKDHYESAISALQELLFQFKNQKNSPENIAAVESMLQRLLILNPHPMPSD